MINREEADKLSYQRNKEDRRELELEYGYNSFEILKDISRKIEIYARQGLTCLTYELGDNLKYRPFIIEDLKKEGFTFYEESDYSKKYLYIYWGKKV